MRRNPLTNPPKAILAYALKVLSQREHSAYELKRKLHAKGYPKTDIDAVLGTLQEDGLQSDARFTEVFIQSRYHRGYGPFYILQALKTKGIDKVLANDHLLSNPFDWGKRAQEVREKHFGKEQPINYKVRAKQLKFMERRGFGEQLKQLFEVE